MTHGFHDPQPVAETLKQQAYTLLVHTGRCNGQSDVGNMLANLLPTRSCKRKRSELCFYRIQLLWAITSDPPGAGAMFLQLACSLNPKDPKP